MRKIPKGVRESEAVLFPGWGIALVGGVVVILCVIAILMVNLRSDASPPKDTSSIEDGSETEVVINTDEHGIKTIQDVPFGPEMVLVPGGSFWMGLDKTDGNNIKGNFPRHNVKVNHYYLSKYEITVKQFRAFVKKTGYKTDCERGKDAAGWFTGGSFNWQSHEFQQKETHPVVCVSWNDAISYCKWLSKRTNNNYRLPTEEEWEYACQAGKDALYFWGNKFEDGEAYCNGPDQSLLKSINRTNKKGLEEFISFLPWNDGYIYTSPVGVFKPNKFGLYDMQGNVSEWCQDTWKGDYDGNKTLWHDSMKAHKIKFENLRVLRGGNWAQGVPWFRTAYREFGTKEISHSHCGFRIARDIEKENK